MENAPMYTPSLPIPQRTPNDAPTEQQQQPFNWRDHLPVHPACDAYPELPHDELIALGHDIRTRGLQFPIVVWRKKNPREERYHDDFQLIDGRNRLDAMTAAGIKFAFEFAHGNRRSFLRFLSSELCGFDGSRIEIEVKEIPPEEVEAYVASANLHRRHLTSGDKDRLVADLSKANPTKSNRQIAVQSKVASHPHVAKIRTRLEKAGDVETVSTSIDTKGREQPAKRKYKAGKKSISVVKPDSTTVPPATVVAPIETMNGAEPEAKSKEGAAGLGSTIAR
jgi:hypothetical protein